ncbi:MAG TPA: acylphosphatase [Bryobacteraceae bacterium]|nr:acylphosphatase [Bryobacteraceae bacterium]
MKKLMARRYVISGRVQGVGFRYFAERAAKELGVTGWARNLDDGSVEVHANGTRAALDDFEGRLRSGPSFAEVRGFEVTEDVETGEREFRIR